MATLPAFEPELPFLGRLRGGFPPKSLIRVKAKITKINGRCIVDFLNTPPAPDQDIMFHLSIRLDQSCIVRNSFQRSWRNEERSGTFRIGFDEVFEVKILAEWDRYRIAVDGEQIADFSHRSPMRLVQYVSVCGDVAVEHVMLEELQGSWPC